MNARMKRGVLVAALLFCALATTACSKNKRATDKADKEKPDFQVSHKEDPNEVLLIFTYGSEKEGWIKEVTREFNEEGKKTGGGKKIRVEAIPLGSGELIEEVLTERRKAHLVSPASAAYVELGNGRSKMDKKGELVSSTKNLVLSPVVIAMWKSMADALRKSGKEVGWADVQNLARDPKGWAAAGRPEWGEFRFAHTHPLYSNSGLIALLAQVYAGAGKTKDLTSKDADDPRVAKYIEEIQRSVVHYGSSTGFFGKKIIDNGKGYLSAAVLYENMVVESYRNKLADPLVAIYPREGTFMSDHPIGVVHRDWVTADHKEAAKAYIDFLLAKPQQVKAMKYGFRPGDESISLDAPLDRAHGIDPEQPKKLLEVPPAEVMESIVALWPKVKKPSRVVLVVDVSGSMQKDQRLVKAQKAAQDLVGRMGERDIVSLLAFSDKSRWVRQDLKMTEAGKQELNEAIGNLFPGGQTALYDSVNLAWKYLQDKPAPEAISAVVVLTDGEDNRSSLKLSDLLEKIKADFEKSSMRVFTIAYGGEANYEELKKIADVTQAKSYKGEPKSILEVLKDIATFF